MTFAERVVQLRKAAGIRSTAKLAGLVKISQPSMWAIEKGETAPDELKTSTFMRLVVALKTNPNYLYSGTGPISPLINPNLEEAEAASLYRQLKPENQRAWMAAGYAFLNAQPTVQPSADNPFPTAPVARLSKKQAVAVGTAAVTPPPPTHGRR